MREGECLPPTACACLCHSKHIGMDVKHMVPCCTPVLVAEGFQKPA